MTWLIYSFLLARLSNLWQPLCHILTYMSFLCISMLLTQSKRGAVTCIFIWLQFIKMYFFCQFVYSWLKKARLVQKSRDDAMIWSSEGPLVPLTIFWINFTGIPTICGFSCYWFKQSMFVSWIKLWMLSIFIIFNQLFF